MAGIYIHIPFCHQKCNYCDFYKTLNTSRKAEFLAALKKEALERVSYLNGAPVESVYLGGGTPSVLNEEEIGSLLDFIRKCFTVLSHAEITLEANPDDLNPGYLRSLNDLGINRLSIGIQSFNDFYLKNMNRRHNGQQAVASIENALAAGFSNLSTDLIYGFPGLTLQQWEKTLKTMFSYPITHLSAYHLTYHEGTPFYSWLRKGKIRELDENESIAQYYLLLDESSKAGFEAYEISNFARQQMYALHNSAYWTGKPYLGLGPSAHSFNGIKRRWNIASVTSYNRAVVNKMPYWEEEELTDNEKYNEYILTRLRTCWGVSTDNLENRFGEKYSAMFKEQAIKYLTTGKIRENSGVYTLTRQGLFISDDILAGFMII